MVVETECYGTMPDVTPGPRSDRPAWARRLAAVAVVVVLALVGTLITGVVVARRPLPQTDSTLRLTGLNGTVEVLRDAQGVPQVYADEADDLFRAQGYVQAQDRFFEMDFRRHVTAGRLSELLGKATLETDMYIRTMGWRRVAAQEYDLLAPSTKEYLRAYSAGVNAYLKGKSATSLSLEYTALALTGVDYRPEKWTPVDSLAWLKAMAWDLRGNYTDELTRGLLVGKISLPQLAALYPDYPYDAHPTILSPDEWAPRAPSPVNADTRGGTKGASTLDSSSDPADQAQFGQPGPTSTPSGEANQEWLSGQDAEQVLLDTSMALAAVPDLLGKGEGIGSNSWVVSGDHTTTGKPILANDPHLSVTQPSLWLQAGLHCRVVSAACPYDVTGFTFAGFPGVIIGHNQRMAWGFTNLDPDVTDFYLEDLRGDTVRRGSEFVDLVVREEVIKVAGGEDLPITIRETSHGPILSDVMADMADLGEDAPLGGSETSNDYAVSLAWTALEPSRTAEAVFALNAATDWDAFRSAARLFAVPSQNLIYADVDGNIGYQAPGQVPIRKAATHATPPGFYPAPGWESAYDWQGFVDFEDMPFVYNPQDGIIVTANQAVTRGSRPFLTTEWDKGYRSSRIGDLLQAAIDQGPLSVESMGQIQLDDHNTFAERLVPYLLAADLDDPFYTQAQALLSTWDFTAPAEGEQSAAAAYFYAVYDELLKTVLDDELPPGLGASGSARSMLLMENLLATPDNPWWDDRTTVGVIESRDEVIRSAMTEARLDLTRRISKDPANWSWGKLHQVRLQHEVLSGDSVPGLVRDIFGQGPRPVSGSSAMVNAMNWDASEETFEVTSAPSMRMVVDLSDLDASTWVNHTGNSGHPFHPHWSDQTDEWIAGETFPWPFTRDAVDESGQDTLVLKPAADRR